MDYEKKYKEAMKACKELSDSFDNETLTEELEKIFPELKESEDENTKKEIINYLECQRRDEPSRKDTHNKWISYIEKHALSRDDYDFLRDCARILKTFGWQSYADRLTGLCPALGEETKAMMSTPIFPKESGDERIRKEIISMSNTLGKTEWIAWLEKQGGKTVDEWLSSLLHKVICHYINDPNIPYSERDEVSKKIIPYVEQLEKQGEQKPAWSEEDESWFKEIELMARSFSCDMDYQANFFKWLKSLKDRVQPKPVQEWNGSDDAHLHSIITHLQDFIESHPNTTGADIQGENVAWLKSLRPQNRWRPSTFHLECIEDAITLYEKRGINAIGLKEILDELKKLMEE